MERGDVPTGVSWGNLRERDHSEDLGVDENMILQWIFKKRDWAWTGFIWFTTGTVTGCCE